MRRVWSPSVVMTMDGHDPYYNQSLALPYPRSMTTNTVYGSFMSDWPRTYLTKTGPFYKNRQMDQKRKAVKVTSSEIGSFLNYEPVIRWRYDHGRKRSLPMERAWEPYPRRRCYDDSKENYDTHEHFLPPIDNSGNLKQYYSENDFRELSPIECAEELRLPNIQSVDLNFHDRSKARVIVKDVEIHTARF